MAGTMSRSLPLNRLSADGSTPFFMASSLMALAPGSSLGYPDNMSPTRSNAMPPVRSPSHQAPSQRGSRSVKLTPGGWKESDTYDRFPFVRSDRSVLKWNAFVLRTGSGQKGPSNGSESLSSLASVGDSTGVVAGNNCTHVPWTFPFKPARTIFFGHSRTEKWKAT